MLLKCNKNIFLLQTIPLTWANWDVSREEPIFKFFKVWNLCSGPYREEAAAWILLIILNVK